MKKIVLFLIFVFTILSNGVLFSNINVSENNKPNHITRKDNNAETTETTEDSEEPVALELDTSIVDTYNSNAYVLGRFATIAKINSINELKKYSVVKAKPESVILYLDKNMNLTNETGDSLNLSLVDAYENYIKAKMIPLLYLANDEIADAYIAYYPYNFNILDMAIIAPEASIVKKVREANTAIRGILDYSSQIIRRDDLKELIIEMNISNVQTIIINQESAQDYVIEYFQLRYRTVWSIVNEKSTIEVLDNINKGIDGMICNEPDYIYGATNLYLNTPSITRNITKKKPIATHRCLDDYYENSLEGAIMAYEAGASQMEFDLRLTKDNQVVVMHDSTINRTTNGTGNVTDYTAEEITKFKIDSSSSGYIGGEGVNVPMFEDFLEYFKNKDVVLKCEIKLVGSKILQIMRELFIKYDFFDKAVILSFEPNIHKTSRKYLPECTVVPLKTITFFNYAKQIKSINQCNGAYYGSTAHPELARYAIARGYYVATITTPTFTSLMGNFRYDSERIEKVQNFAYGLTSSQNYIKVDSFDNLEIELECQTYDKSIEKTMLAKPLYIEVDGEVAKAIFYAHFVTEDGYEFCIFSDVINLTTSQVIADENNQVEENPGVSSGDTLEGDNFGRLQ